MVLVHPVASLTTLCWSLIWICVTCISGLRPGTLYLWTVSALASLKVNHFEWRKSPYIWAGLKQVQQPRDHLGGVIQDHCMLIECTWTYNSHFNTENLLREQREGMGSSQVDVLSQKKQLLGTWESPTLSAPCAAHSPEDLVFATLLLPPSWVLWAQPLLLISE